ncbi:hypothetical protein HZS_5699, partial [Henneguya salminicola]
MRYVAAYILSKLAGEEDPTVVDIKNIITAADGDFEDKQAKIVVDRLKGRDIFDLIEKGKLKISSLAPVGSSTAPDSAKEVHTESAAKESEPEEESDEDMGMAG